MKEEKGKVTCEESREMLQVERKAKKGGEIHRDGGGGDRQKGTE